MKSVWVREYWFICRGEGLVSKRWQIKFRRMGITQKEAHNIHNGRNFEIKIATN